MQTSNRTTLLRRRETATVIVHEKMPPEWFSGTLIVIRPKIKPASPVEPKPAEAAQDKVSEAEKVQATPKADEPTKVE